MLQGTIVVHQNDNTKTMMLVGIYKHLIIRK